MNHPIDTDERLRISLVQQLDQLNAGLDRHDKDAIEHARKTLAMIVRDGSPILLCEVFQAIAQAWEKP